MRSRIAVIVLDVDEGHLLERTLPLLERQTRAPDALVIVDNACSDGSPAWIRQRYPQARMIALPERVGFAEANHAGIHLARDCDWIALLNADAFPEPDWLAALEEAAREHPDTAAFSSLMLEARDPSRLDGAGDELHGSGLPARRYKGRELAANPDALVPREVFGACAGAAMYRRDVFEAVGGFDESFFLYFEDVDLAFRMRLAGHDIRYVPRSVVRHLGSTTTGEASDLTTYHLQRNLVWLFAKNMPWPLWLRYLPMHLLANVAGLVGFTARGRGRVVGKAKLDALRGLPRILRERRRVQGARGAEADQIRAALSPRLDWEIVLPTLARPIRMLAAARARGLRPGAREGSEA